MSSNSPFTSIALFGANGQIGKPIFEALIRCKDPQFQITAFVSPNSSFDLRGYGDINATVKRVDLNKVARDDLAAILAEEKVDVAISALGGEIITKQGVIQDAAAKAGVGRFYPSEFGMHQVAWLSDNSAYIHPTWAVKMKCFDDAIKHPAIKSGQMTYTVVGCGEFYDVPDEPLLCPWLKDADALAEKGYVVQCVGNPNAKMDYSSVVDVANFVVATLQRPEISANKVLGFRSDHISYAEIVQLLGEYSGRKAELNLTSVDQMEKILKDPSLVSEELKTGSTFPVTFWMLLRHVQGQGTFWRPPGLLSNDLFPKVKPVTMDEYFKALFAK